MTASRKETIASLLEFDANLELIRSRLFRFDWDSEIEVRCLPQHVRQILDRYLAGTLSADEVEAWSNLVENWNR